MMWIVIPSYNCGQALHRCFDTVKKQSLEEFKVLIIDDCSTEKEHAETCQAWAEDEGWDLVRHDENMKAPYSMVAAIEQTKMDPDDIIFLLDGDDFIHENALYSVSNAYERYPDLWVTFGDYMPYPPDPLCPVVHDYPTLVRRDRSFRKYGNILFNHPLTFRRFLWDQLTFEDLHDDNGQRYPAGYDQLIMFPMLEMAGPDHYACLDQKVYYYNTENPISDAVLGRPGPDILNRPKRDLYVAGPARTRRKI